MAPGWVYLVASGAVACAGIAIMIWPEAYEKHATEKIPYLSGRILGLALTAISGLFFLAVTASILRSPN